MKKIIAKFGIITIVAILSIAAINWGNFASAIVPGTNQIVSHTSTGAQANNSSGSAIISANGKVVVFTSNASNILPSGGPGIFEKNLSTGTIARVAVSTAGVIGDNAANTVVSNISSTGRYILFTAYSSNLIDGSVNSTTQPQVYLRDTVDSTTTLIGKTAAGVIYTGSFIYGSDVSSDGRFVTLLSNATNLNPDSTDGSVHIYRLDRTTGNFSILDRNTNGVVAGSPSHVSASCDGSILTFQNGSNLIVGDPSSVHPDVYVLDLRAPTPVLTNITKGFNDGSEGPKISCNGDYVVFKSAANNIDSSVTITDNHNNRPYVYDRVNGTYKIVPVTNTGTVLSSVDGCGTSSQDGFCADVSDTGVAVFSTNNSALTGVSGLQFYMRDTISGTTQLIPISSSGATANGSSSFNTGIQGSSISADGRVVVYSSNATNLVSGDTNGNSDVFTSLTGN